MSFLVRSLSDVKQELLIQTIYKEVQEERDRQDAKWGADRVQTGLLWSAILTEEVGEAAQAVLKQDRENLREELIQIMAVTRAWLEALDGNKDGISYYGEP